MGKLLFCKKALIGTATIATMALLFAAPTVAAGNGAVVFNACPIVGPNPIGATECNFHFIDGNLSPALYVVDSYHDVVAPNGDETETFHGTIANPTGRAVLLAPGVNTVSPTQTCYSFITGDATPDWQLIISASGNYTLVCHFH